MSRLLLEDKPLIVLPSLAVEVGLNESIFLQQLHYWLQGSPNERDGHVWVYNTYEQWQEQFPFWSISTIRRIVAKLETSGYIISSQFNSCKTDQTKWYRIDYSKFREADSPCVQNGQGDHSNWTDDSFTLNKSIQENTSENTNRKKDDEERGPALSIKVDENKTWQAESGMESSDMANYAMVLERKFLKRRGRGLYPSAKDLQAIQEVVHSGISCEDAIISMNEAFDAYKPKYPGDAIHAFSYVKEHIFRQAYLKKERERAATATGQKHMDFSRCSIKTHDRSKAVRREMVPAWLANPQAERENPGNQSDFEEEKMKLMEELAQYKKKETFVQSERRRNHASS
ncbi:hypothetical protein ACFOU2_15620 [Bacillus songklensis]|uniref:Replication protein n=1 Tax=Bacillus songklensis TaxID=1069116 RepID=A0ABV8B3J5_9BACI